jgi:hypothetical protein
MAINLFLLQSFFAYRVPVDAKVCNFSEFKLQQRVGFLLQKSFVAAAAEQHIS